MAGVQQGSFIGGMQTASTNLLRKESEVIDAKNITFSSTLGGATKQPGYTAVNNNTAIAAGSLTTFYEFKKESGTRIFLAAIESGLDTKIYSSTNMTTWTLRLSGLTPAYKPRFETFLDYVFVTNGIDAPKSWDGIAASFGSTHLTSAPIGKFITQAGFRLIFPNIPASSTSTIQYSTLPASNTVSWPSTFTTDLRTGSPITGLGKNGNSTLIFKDSAIMRFNISTDLLTTAPFVTETEGTTSPSTIRTIGRYTYFFFNGQIWMTNGGDCLYISKKIQRMLDKVSPTAWDTLFAGKSRNLYRLYIGNITWKGKSLTNAYIEYDTDTNTWSYGTYADSFACYGNCVYNGVSYMVAGTSTGKLMLLDSGYDQNGVAFEGALDIGPFYGTGIDQIDTWDIVHIDGERLRGLSVSIEIDGQKEMPLGVCENSKHNYFSIGQIQGFYAKVYIRDNSKKEGFLIQSVNVYPRSRSTSTYDNRQQY